MEFPFAVSPLTLFGRTGRRGKGVPTKGRQFSTNADPNAEPVNIQWRILAPFPRECGSIQTRRFGVGERIVIASDHAAVEMKAMLVAHLQAGGHEVVDLGPGGIESVDYPDYGYKIAEAIDNPAVTEPCEVKRVKNAAPVESNWLRSFPFYDNLRSDVDYRA